MMKRLQQLIDDECGSTTVEMAVLLPLILLTIGFMVSAGQSILMIGASYNADYLGARELMVPGGSVDTASTNASDFFSETPFVNTSDGVLVKCEKNSVDSVCQMNGPVSLIFPVINPTTFVPTTQFQLNTKVVLPTENEG